MQIRSKPGTFGSKRARDAPSVGKTRPAAVLWSRRTTMKITKLTPMVLGTPWRNLTYLKVETDEGLVGVSETRSIRTDAVLAYLKQIEKRYVLGSDPFNVEALVQRAFVDDFLRVNDISGAGIAL